MQGVYRQHILSLAVFTVLALLMSLPVVLNMGDGIAGQGGDPWQALWRLESKADLGFPEFVRDLSGAGEARLANLSVWPWMPLHILFGEPIAYNLIWLLSFILSGYAMALLVRSVTNGTSIFEPAPLLAGIAYMFLPFHSAHALGHFGAMQMQWMPFIIVAAISIYRESKTWKYALLGVLLSVQAWTEHHYMLYLGILALIAAWVWRKDLLDRIRYSHPLQLPLGQGERTRTPLLTKERLGEVMLLVVILIFGVIIPYIPTIKLAATDTDALVLGEEQAIRFSADLFSFIVPSYQHPIWGSFFQTLFGQYFTGNNSESVQYLGVSLLIAILFFHRHIPVGQKRFWIAVMFVFSLISLGPVLHVYGKVMGFPLPYALLQNLPIFSAVRVVARAGALVGLAACVLLGWVIATNTHLPKRERGTTLLIGLLILLEFLFLPFPMQSAQLSPVYDRLSAIPGSAIIEVPSATNYVSASRGLYASALHGKDSLGNIALERGSLDSIHDSEKAAPGVRQLLYLRTTELLENRNEFFNQNIAETLPEAMQWLDAYAVIIHTDSLSKTQNDALSNLFEKSEGFTRELFGDADLYILNPDTAIKSDGVFLMRGDGWEHVGYDPKRSSVFAEIPGEASLILINITGKERAISLSFEQQGDASAPVLRTGSQEIPSRIEQGKIVYEVILHGMEINFVFTNTDSGNAIIQNPELRVESLPAGKQGERSDS